MSIDEMMAEIRRRVEAQPDRAARIAAARAAEPRDLKLIRALCERAGHSFDRRTAAALRSFDGKQVWAFYFVTDRGPHYMIDLGTKVMMFPTDRADHVDVSTLVVEIDDTAQ